MEYNYLLLQNRSLFYKNKNKLTSLNLDTLEVLVEEHTLISNTFIQEDSLVSEIVDLIKNKETVVNLKKVSSALKEIENNKIVSHLRREDYRKISFPIITQSDFLKKYLIDNSFLFSIDAFLNTSNFEGVELDSWYQ